MNISNLLQEYVDSKGITSTSKIKHLTNFGSLVEFLTQDVQSPYYCPNETSEKIMTNKVLLEKVKRVINDCEVNAKKYFQFITTSDEEIILDKESSIYVKTLQNEENSKLDKMEVYCSKEVYRYFLLC